MSPGPDFTPSGWVALHDRCGTAWIKPQNLAWALNHDCCLVLVLAAGQPGAMGC